MQVRFDKTQNGPGLSQAIEKQRSNVIRKGFAATLDRTNEAGAEPVEMGRFQRELKVLAGELQSGSLSQDQMIQQFVEIVAHGRQDLSMLHKHIQAAQNAVGELLGEDPHFTTRLQEQLKKLAKDR